MKMKFSLALLVGLLTLSATAAQPLAPADIKALESLALNAAKPVESRIAALWTLDKTGKLTPDALVKLIGDASPAVRKNALKVLGSLRAEADLKLISAITGQLSDPQTRVEAILALGKAAPATTKPLVDAYPALNDAWSQSAAVGVLSANPAQAIADALSAANSDALRPLVEQLSQQIGGRPDAAVEAARLIASLGRAKGSDALKQVALENLSRSLRPAVAPAWSAGLELSFRSLLSSPNPGVPAAALPLIARWDKGGAMAGDLKTQLAQLTARLNDASQPDDARAQVVSSLLGVRQLNPEILPAVVKLLGSPASPALQKRIVTALGTTADAAAGPLFAEAWPRLTAELQESLFGQIIKRSDWSLALVEALKSGRITLTTLGPPSVYRLRTHGDGAVARRANSVIDELRGPEVKEKNALIAKFTPEVEKPGDAVKGKAAFTQNCAVCHKFNGEGKEVGPELTGMGAHGPAELLVSVLDPNREVDPSFIAWSLETKDGESIDGVIASENKSVITVRNNSGEFAVKTADIKNRRNTGRSQMPEGFEALGGEVLRDILAYVCGADGKYRFIDLRPAFTANSTKGIYASLDPNGGMLDFKKFGLIKAGDVPFEILHPNKTVNGNNLVVLKSRNGITVDDPQKVEVTNLNLKASRLHVLGAVGGWAWPFGGDEAKGLPVAKLSVTHTDGQVESWTLLNGVHVIDYINDQPQGPGSVLVPGLVNHNAQVRTFSRVIRGRAPIQKIALESFNNQVAPTFAALTAELGEAHADALDFPLVATPAPAAPAAPPAPLVWGAGVKVLLVGGGSSHDYGKWFNTADSATLKAAGYSVNYTEDGDVTARELANVDVAVLSVNRSEWATPALRQALLEFARRGKGLVLLHPGLWYNFGDWPEYNRVLAGGGSRGHDALGEFSVNVLKAGHPVMKGVPASFQVTDELYYMAPDEKGTPLEILAETSPSKKYSRPHPSVFIVKHPQARIVGLAIGHDGRAHDLPEYKALLTNAVKWAAGK